MRKRDTLTWETAAQASPQSQGAEPMGPMPKVGTQTWLMSTAQIAMVLMRSTP